MADPASVLTTLLLLIIVLLLSGGSGLVWCRQPIMVLNCVERVVVVYRDSSCHTRHSRNWLTDGLNERKNTACAVGRSTIDVDGFSLAGHCRCGSALCLCNVLAEFSWGRTVHSTPDESRTRLCSQKTAPVSIFWIITMMLIMMTDGDDNKYDKNCAAFFLGDSKKWCVCVSERTRRHRHSACQPTGWERTVQEEAHRPEPRVQEEHTRGEDIRYSQTRLHPALTIMVRLGVSLCLFALFINFAVIIYSESRGGVDGAEMRDLAPKNSLH